MARSLQTGLREGAVGLRDGVGLTNYAWDIRDTEDSQYVDDCFNPKSPYKASGNDTCGGKVDIVGLPGSQKF